MANITSYHSPLPHLQSAGNVSGLYLDYYLGRNAQKGYNTMAGKKKVSQIRLTNRWCQPSLILIQRYQRQKNICQSRGLDGRKPPMKLLGEASYVNGELHAFHPEEKLLYSSIYCQWYYSGISER